ncbi:MAG: AAA family ATPase [Bacillota bacterium]|nr:AAA family ATPase [Bacillota bacterium]
MENNDIQSELEINIKKEIELSNEKERLKEIISLINKEILSYISKRKEIADFIMDYRKKVIEEYRDDEDKLVDYFDHEKYVKEESYNTVDKRLRELTILSKSPYFGRIDFVSDDSNDLDEIESIRIGRFGMTPEGSYEPLVLDWRAPAAALFYNGKLGKASYTAPMGKVEAEILLKRQYIIKKAELQGLFDSDLNVKDDILQLVLSKNAGEKLKDIIMTIQEEQDNLIRQPREKTIVADGVAGSGKTTIALHRVAYLLYNYREILQDKVLILGPNSIFMEYIAAVLPSLGESGVKQTTFKELAMNILEIQDVMSFKDYMEKVLSNDKKFIDDILYKTSTAFIDKLDNLIESLNKEYFKPKDIILYDKKLVDADEISRMFNEYFMNMPLFRRSKKVKRIIFSKIRDERDEIVRRIQKQFNDAVGKLTNEGLDTQYNSLNYVRRNKIREVIKTVMQLKKSMKYLNNPNCNDIYKDLNGDRKFTIDDLSPLIYLKVKLEGLKLKEEIKHVVIDEAQDYSLLQFMVINEITKCNSFTIVGDSNQRLIPIDGEVPMNLIQGKVPKMNVEYFRLLKSYRSTQEIMNYANKYLSVSERQIVPLVRNGSQVEVKNVHNDSNLISEIILKIKEYKDIGMESIAVICTNLSQAKYIGELIKNEMPIKILDKEDLVYNGGIVAVPSYFAKGLEFDAVILIDNKNLNNEKLKYVMSTRALHELCTLSIDNGQHN